MDKKQEITNQKDNLIERNIVLVNNVFISDKQSEFIFKKTDKIVTAIHLVSNFFPVSESLRNDVRQTSVSLLKTVVNAASENTQSKEIRFKNISTKLLELSSILSLSYHVGLVSKMNFEILNVEINKLAENIANQSKHDIDPGGHILDTRMFDDADLDATEFVSNADVLYKGHKRQESVFYGTVKDLKKKLNFKEAIKSPKKTISNSDRRDKIIAEVSKIGEVSVKDISNVIKDCSEKTLQRELLAMVSDGILLKTGERRWSKYSLKK